MAKRPHWIDTKDNRRNGWPGPLGLAAFLAVGWLGIVREWPPVSSALAATGALAAVVAATEMLLAQAHRRENTGLNWTNTTSTDVRRIIVKLVGLGGTLALLAFAYWLLPEYHGSFYAPVWQATQYALLASPVLLPTVIAYIGYVDRRMTQPHDELYAAGRLLISLGKDRNAGRLRSLGLALLVKGFFIPLMFVYLCDNTTQLQQLASQAVWTRAQWFDAAWLTLFSIDLGFVTAGYLCAFRLIDTHIRSCDPTAGGWLVALICYQPFWSLISATYIAYEQPWTWGSLLFDQPLAYTAMGTLIAVLTGIYVWASVCFGLRFSNLTYRGTVSWGPYRWTKHPAYIFKNTSWWLIALPFLPFAGVTNALQACGLLLLLNVIYFLRAKTEERHLMMYPEYRTYADQVACHGFLARLRRKFAIAGTRSGQ